MRQPGVFHDTTHAGKRRAERGLSLEEMTDVVRHSELQVQQRKGEHGGFIYEFTRKSGARTLTVMAEVKKTECWLITGWWE